jgi:amino acid adenylation domain-containing protein
MRNQNDVQAHDRWVNESPRERLLRLELELDRQKRTPAGPSPGAHVRETPIPLSYAQERLWFLDQMGLVGAAYNVPLRLRIVGALDDTAVEYSFTEIVRRHEILRTRFGIHDGEPCQRIEALESFAIQRIDLTAIADRTSREHELAVCMDLELVQRFDLANGPAVRVLLVRVDIGDHVLLVTMHHIVADGWSVGLLVNELSSLYASRVSGQRSTLVELPIQYSDYAIWERRSLHSKVIDAQLAYWRDQLSGAPQQSQLPSDKPRPPIPSYKGGVLRFHLPAPLTHALEDLARREGATLFMVVLAAYQILLSRWSGQHDIVIGSPTAGRNRPEVERLIGFFVNTLALRITSAPGMSFRQLLEHVRDVTLGAFANQDAPFESIVADLRPERSLAHHPVFQVMLALQNYPEQELSLSGLKWKWGGAEFVTAHFDLTLYLYPVSDGYLGVLEYAEDLFLVATIERMQRHFRALLEGIVREPDTAVSRLPILSKSEIGQVLLDWNSWDSQTSSELLVADLCVNQSEEMPDSIAVIRETAHLTYRELDRRATRMAEVLTESGAHPDSLVGVCLQRSLEMVIALVGIVKSGAAYIPLDPNYPPERLLYMIEDSAPDVVLTDETTESFRCDRARVLSLDGIRIGIVRGSQSWKVKSTSCVAKQNLIYVIYTSGSTGHPKGTAMSQASMTNLIEWHRNTFGTKRGRRVLQFAALGFDVAFQEIFSTLCSGDTLVLVDECLRRDARALLRFLSTHCIERLFVPPIMLRALAECASTDAALPRLQDVITAGEQLHVTAEVVRLFERLESCKLHNHYGPTETHVVTTLTMSGASDQWPSLPSIGKPIARTQLYILDPEMQPVPVGVAGELYIGGFGVGRGYLRRPELTSERFVADPFHKGAGTRRLYKTGDLCRWRPEGTVEYLGRNDDQVKIRGFRVELGDIEAQLARHPGVAAVAVLAREDVERQKRLVAYITATADAHLKPEDLRSFLVGVLPEHMVPSAFVTVDRLPQTPNGKLDRRALPAPDYSTATARGGFEEPQGTAEKIIASVWRELLCLDHVSRRDNFFELGGHSLLIVSLVERMRKLNLRTDIRAVYKNPTVCGLAAVSGKDATDEFEVPKNLIPQGCEAITPQMLPLLDLEPRHIELICSRSADGAKGIEDIYPLSPVQEGMLFHRLMADSQNDPYARSVLFSFPSADSLSSFVDALQWVIGRHDILRTAVLWSGLPSPVQVLYRKAELRVEYVAPGSGEDPACRLRELMEQNDALDIQRAPMLRLFVTQGVATLQQYVLLQTHHLIFDNESLELLLSEVTARAAGNIGVLRKPVPYRNYVARTVARTGDSAAEAFFRDRLGTVSETTAPFGFADTHLDIKGSRSARTPLDSRLGSRLRNQARRLGVSAATLFHAAWGLVVAKSSGRDDVVYGTVLSARLADGTAEEAALGVFVTTLPLRLRVETTTGEFVAQTQRELTELVAHRHVSLVVAQRCSGLKAGAPLFSSLFNYVHQSVERETGLARVFGAVPLASTGGTNYPIVLSIYDQGDSFSLEVLTNAALSPDRIIGYMATALESLNDSLDRRPELPAARLSIVPERELDNVLRLFNETGLPLTAGDCLHGLFEKQANITPDAVATMSGSRCLSYATLNSTAESLAEGLREMGMGPGQFAGIFLERGLEMVVSVLAALKTGGAYVPLDINLPTERLRYIFADAAPVVTMTQKKQISKLPNECVNVVSLDADWLDHLNAGIRGRSGEATSLSSMNLAYLIYTSGSTGQPKAVAIEHRQAVNLISWALRAFGREPFARTLGSTSLTFDLSVYELFVPLSSGGCVCVVPNALSLLTESVEVTLINTVPSAARELMESGRIPLSVSAVNVAGEVLKREVAEKLLEINSIRRVHNLYGPSETTTYSTWASMSRESGFVSSIGRPIANTHVYILDRHLDPVPIGVIGEIYIGGAGVARGYLNRPSLTAERFVPDPFANSSARIYRTGDLGRWHPDGMIQYLGRNDYQLKIRGFRVEPEEIEAHLSRHPGIREVAVIARETAPGDLRLVAYVVQRTPAEINLTPSVMREYLRSLVPDYMVPATFMVLDRFPLTPNGKLDRRALPQPTASLVAKRESPRGEVEVAICKVWQQLLGVSDVGRQDNFFELGGHSLLATRIASRVRESLGVDLSIRAIFDAPTIEELARHIGLQQPGQTSRQSAWESELSQNLRTDISRLSDEDVLAELSEANRELEATENENPGVHSPCGGT